MARENEHRRKHIVFFGDSITQAGESPEGYITKIRQAIRKSGKEDRFIITGSGIAGNKVYDLYLRMDNDILVRNPDTVFIYIGVNDVWHKLTHGTGTDADKFEHFYRAIITRLQSQNIKVVVCTPALIGEKYDRANGQDEDLDGYSDIIRKLSKRMHCGLVDLRELCMRYEQQYNVMNKKSGILTTDGVHLNDAGNKLVAEAMLSQIEL